MTLDLERRRPAGFAIVLALFSTEALAQSRTLYGPDGRSRRLPSRENWCPFDVVSGHVVMAAHRAA